MISVALEYSTSSPGFMSSDSCLSRGCSFTLPLLSTTCTFWCRLCTLNWVPSTSTSRLPVCTINCFSSVVFTTSKKASPCSHTSRMGACCQLLSYFSSELAFSTTNDPSGKLIFRVSPYPVVHCNHEEDWFLNKKYPAKPMSSKPV